MITEYKYILRMRIIYDKEIQAWNVYDEPKFKTRENVTRELDKFIN